MPELPEVETVRIALTSQLLKRKICKVIKKSEKLRFLIPKNIKNIENRTLEKIKRRGKYLIFYFNSNYIMLFHLGMTGVFRTLKKLDYKNHDHLIFKFSKINLIYNDVRRFGFVKIYLKKEFKKSLHLLQLGEEPFSKRFDVNYLNDLACKKKQNVKNFLMDQRNIAGLGNIYCSEILFDAGISPLKTTSNLDFDECGKLVNSTKKVLRRAIRMGGTSIQNFKDPGGSLGYFKNKLKVYDRENKNCYNCKKKSKIKKIIQSGRSTFFCDNCQK